MSIDLNQPATTGGSNERSSIDERLEALIESSGGHWREDEFCIGGPDLMSLLRAASCQPPSAGDFDGEQLYEMWQDELDRAGTMTDDWDELEQLDQVAWSGLAQKIELKWTEEQRDQSQLVRHAKFELRKQLEQGRDTIDGAVAHDVVDLIARFASQGHSGTTAPFAVQYFSHLALFKPLGPLTGEDDEWNEAGIHNDVKIFQNRRCSHVFKRADRFNGQAYDLQGKIFRTPDGHTWNRGEDSWVPVTFPYTPHTEIVEVQS